ncbi:MAG: hypothetical protein WC844_03675 [Patescibacteria group bacterium]
MDAIDAFFALVLLAFALKEGAHAFTANTFKVFDLTHAVLFPVTLIQMT